MNEWDQRIRQHRVFGEMQSLGPAIDTASSTEALSPEAVAGLERLKSILAFSGKRIAAADPLVSTTAPLDEIASAFVAVREEIERFNSDHNITRIATANTSADRVLAVINQVPGTYSPEELGALISVAVSSREMISNSLSVSAKTLSEFSANTELLKSRLGDLAGSIQTEQQKLAQIATEYQAQFSTSQEKRNQESARPYARASKI